MTRSQSIVAAGLLVTGLILAGAQPASATTAPAGGGTWDYGSYAVGPGQKVCYSRYLHPTKTHGSTAAMAGTVSRSSATRPGAWSQAQVTGSIFASCQAYWRDTP